ncbi:MAG: SusC/RagA family TonB-linked outer membrane protein [Bacteroidales bacterium]
MRRLFLMITGWLILSCVAFAQERTIKGEVTAASDKEPLIGAYVINTSKDGTVGEITDYDGKYQISAKSGDVLKFSYIGMESVSVTVKDQNTINVAMNSDSKELEELVVIGYGTRKKGTITGSVTQVDAKSIEARPVASFDQALQGQVAGLSVTTSSGEPSASSSVRIRGVGSISAGTAPLYIMDGVAISAGDFSTLNMNDIENITVLKDASSTSIYGARAANGVIVITTKRGKFGDKGTVSFRAQYGISSLMESNYKMMNTEQMLELEVLTGMRSKDDPMISSLSKINTNWTDELYRNGHTQNYEFSAMGGTDKLSYYISAAYFEQEGITARSGLERYTVRSNIETNVNNWLKLGLNMTAGYSETMSTVSGSSIANPALAAFVSKPYRAVRDENGDVITNFDGDLNPVHYIETNPSKSTDVKLVASLFAEVKLLDNLKFKTLGGIDAVDMRTSSRSLPSYIGNLQVGGNASESFGRGYRLTWTNTVTYLGNYKDKHNYTLLGGQEAIVYNSDNFAAATQGIADDRLSHMGAGIIPVLATGGYSSGYTYLSAFARGEYNYDYKYYVDLSLRADGSSRFAKGNKWAPFWSVGTMWDVTKENFWNDNKILTGLQLTASIGTSGNSEIGYNDYQYWVSTGPIYNGVSGMAPSPTPGNEDLTWESIMSTNVGLNLRFINRFNMKLDYYSKVTTDMLMAVPVSQVTGYNTITSNIGKMTNQGVEFEISGDLYRSKNWGVNLSTNFSYNHNRINELYDGAEGYVSANTGTKLQVDRPYGSFFMPRYAGVNPANGDPLWYDKDGNVTNEFSNENAVFLDKTYYAPWSGGTTLSVDYKGFSLSAFFNWVADKYVFNNVRFFTENSSPEYISAWNQSTKMLNMWQKPGDVTEIPRAGTENQFDDRWIENSSFFKLKNVTLAYNFPSTLLQKASIGSARIFVQGQNLFTLTKFQGFDPEVDSNLTFGRYPSSRQFVFGLDLKF